MQRLVALLLIALTGGCSLGGTCCRIGCCPPSGIVRTSGSFANDTTRAARRPKRAAPAGTVTAAPASRAHQLADKIHPRLRNLLATTSGPMQVRVIVTFRDTVHFRPLPDLVAIAMAPETLVQFHGPPPRAPARLAPYQALRAADYDTLTDSLQARSGGGAIREFWLARAQAVTMPLAQVPALAAWGQVVYLEPARSGERPPGEVDPTVTAARTAVGADALIEMDLARGRMALLDTGVRFDHEAFADVTFGVKRDCVDGNADCAGTSAKPGETCPETAGHGTGTAALMVGKGRLDGAAFEGLTNARLDSYRVYYPDGSGGDCVASLDAEAAAEAIQLAVARGNRVIVVETQGEGSASSIMSAESDKAYELGAMVVAAAGNYGEGNLGAPGNARRAVSVGAWDVGTGRWVETQSWGPTPEDGRVKPDLIAPTSCRTAGAKSDDHVTYLGETSGATPIAAAMAFLLRNFMRGGASSIAPGAVIATMLASTSQDISEYDLDRHGAGKIEFPEDAVVWSDEVDLATGETAEWELDVSEAGVKRIEVAAWWPEEARFDAAGYPVDTHSDIDLEVIRLSGLTETVAASSAHPTGVFERASVRITGGASKKWVVRLTGRNVLVPPQHVYWTAVARP